MDQTFVGEMRWLAGHSLAQTVFTCLYLHDVKNIADYRLLAMAKAVLKCCGIILHHEQSAIAWDFESLMGPF